LKFTKLNFNASADKPEASSPVARVRAFVLSSSKFRPAVEGSV
jgi:hypothetical protein